MISFDDVSYIRPDGEQPVLSSLSLTIEQGETVAMVGRSGAGKSTALKLINRMLDPQSGRVVVDGRETRAWDPYELRRRTGYVMQEVGLFPHLSVERNIATVPILEGWRPERISARTRELMALVELDPAAFAARMPHELSGGQRQRVGVARALAADPPVLLMDEPFGALDPITRAELQRQFRKIQAAVGKTVVLVTHDMREAFALADRIAVLERGRLIACAPPRELQSSTDPVVRLLLDSMEPA